ncbi:hypothetical protein [Dyadobacter sp. 32]|uniref:hypothetical protein n=1 Tax=Dyadobacter sp. 32 TaxID=538966 RepID=UPI0011EF0A85
MTYKTEDGELITGSSPLEILTNLKNGSRFDSERELDEYLEEFLIRIREYYGVAYSHFDYEKTLNYLVEVGYLTAVELI